MSTPPEGMIDARMLHEFVRLTERKEDLESSLADVMADRKRLEQRIIKMLIRAGVSGVPTSGRNVHLHRQTWGQYPKGREEAIEALRDAGLYDDYVKPDFNHQSLSAYLRALTSDKDGEAEGLPPEFEGRITTVDNYSVRATR